LSATQIRALRRLRNSTFVRTVAGWHPPFDCLDAFSTQTMDSLRKRGLAKLFSFNTRARITAAGQREAARHR
jgi:hypothetical protein